MAAEIRNNSACMAAYVYMLRCADGSFYVGSATGHDLSRRIEEHQSGAYPGYTWSRRPVELVWSEHFDRFTDAIGAERKLKGWSRAKKLALINPNFSLLHQLAKRRAGKSKLARG
jgi:putative endonuclease